MVADWTITRAPRAPRDLRARASVRVVAARERAPASGKRASSAGAARDAQASGLRPPAGAPRDLQRHEARGDCAAAAGPQAPHSRAGAPRSPRAAGRRGESAWRGCRVGDSSHGGSAAAPNRHRRSGRQQTAQSPRTRGRASSDARWSSRDGPPGSLSRHGLIASVPSRCALKDAGSDGVPHASAARYGAGAARARRAAPRPRARPASRHRLEQRSQPGVPAAQRAQRSAARRAGRFATADRQVGPGGFCASSTRPRRIHQKRAIAPVRSPTRDAVPADRAGRSAQIARSSRGAIRAREAGPRPRAGHRARAPRADSCRPSSRPARSRIGDFDAGAPAGGQGTWVAWCAPNWASSANGRFRCMRWVDRRAAAVEDAVGPGDRIAVRQGELRAGSIPGHAGQIGARRLSQQRPDALDLRRKRRRRRASPPARRSSARSRDAPARSTRPSRRARSRPRHARTRPRSARRPAGARRACRRRRSRTRSRCRSPRRDRAAARPRPRRHPSGAPSWPRASRRRRNHSITAT